MSDTLTYARVDGPPAGWWGLKVWDRDALAYVDMVIEVDTEKGWLRRYARGEDGRLLRTGELLAVDWVRGRFAIDRPGEVRSELWTGHDGRGPLELLRDRLLEPLAKRIARRLIEEAFEQELERMGTR